MAGQFIQTSFFACDKDYPNWRGGKYGAQRAALKASMDVPLARRRPEGQCQPYKKITGARTRHLEKYRPATTRYRHCLIDITTWPPGSGWALKPLSSLLPSETKVVRRRFMYVDLTNAQMSASVGTPSPPPCQSYDLSRTRFS